MATPKQTAYGYVVRIETKQGYIYRPRTLARTLGQNGTQDANADHLQNTRRLVATPGQLRRFSTASRNTKTAGVQHPSPKVKDWVRLKGGGNSGSGRSSSASLHPRLGHDSIELGLDLARSDVRLPGEPASTASTIATLTETGLDHRDTVEAAYHVDGLDGIQHAEPGYSVRLVDVRKRRGKKGALSTRETSPIEPSVPVPQPEASLLKELPVPEGLRLFTFESMWEEENPDVDDHVPHHLLGLDSISLDDIENVQYVLIDDEDLHSMSASWVELESVVDSDD